MARSSNASDDHSRVAYTPAKPTARDRKPAESNCSLRRSIGLRTPLNKTGGFDRNLWPFS